MPRSAPFANASLIVCFTRSGPMESAITSPPCFSFSRSASSSAKLSGSFISKPMSDSLIQFPAIASGASFAGTCLMHTTIFMSVFLLAVLAPAFRPASFFSGEKCQRKIRCCRNRLCLLVRPALENQGSICAAKSKGIRKRVVHGLFACLVRHIVQVAFRIGIELIDGRRQDSVTQSECTDAGFETARAAEQMPGHGFRRANRQFLRDGALAEQALHRARFNGIADRRGGSVRVDVADIVRRKFC